MKTLSVMVLVGSVWVGCTGPSMSGNPGTGSSQDNPPAGGAVTRLKSFFPPNPSDPDDWNLLQPESLVAVRDKLYFAINEGDPCCALWTSDGTEKGTVAVKTFDPAKDAAHLLGQLTAVDDRLFFVTSGIKDTSGDYGLWVSDGTSGGTRLVKTIGPGWKVEVTNKVSHGLVALGSSLIFFQVYPASATSPGHIEMWKSDGTAAGTVLVKDLGASSSVGETLVVGSTLYFASSDPAHGKELWKSDGTTAGTQLVQDLAPGTDSSNPADFRTDGQSLYFTASVSAHKALWRSDGSAAGTALVYALDQDTTESTMKPLSLAGHTMGLTALSNDHFLRLYGVDLSGSGPAQRQLLATLPNPGAQNAQQEGDPSISQSASSGGRLYFIQTIPSGHPAPRDVQLWVTDGTQAGTQQLLHPLSLSDEFASSLAVLGDRAVTAAYTENDGIEPWVSDGTVAGTREAKDIEAGKGGSYPRSFTPVGNSMYFVAYDTQHSSSLWVFTPGS